MLPNKGLVLTIALLLLLLLFPTGSARCAIDRHQHTICGGGGSCFDSSGPGKYWLGSSTCDCFPFRELKLLKHVISASGDQEDVWTCVSNSTAP